MAAAYHAGSGSVSSWLEDSRYTKNGILTDIPNPDTAHYVDKITNAYDTYCRLYKKIKEGKEKMAEKKSQAEQLKEKIVL